MLPSSFANDLYNDDIYNEKVISFNAITQNKLKMAQRTWFVALTPSFKQFADPMVKSNINKDDEIVNSINIYREPKEDIIIQITEEGFYPSKLEVKVNQTVTWHNRRDKLPTLLFGMREITNLRSGQFKPGQSFSWIFSKKGEFVYVDAIIIGFSGKISVH